MAVLDRGAAGLDGAVLVDAELGIARDGVAVGGHGLAQDVLHAGLKAYDLVRLVGGRPAREFLLLAAGVGVENLDGGPGELVVVLVRHVGLGHLDGGHGVVDQQHGLAAGGGDGRALGLHRAVRVDLEGGVGRDLVALGRSLFVQRVFHACGKALDHVRLGGGYPLELLGLVASLELHDLAVPVQNLDGGTRELLVVGHVMLGDAHLGDGVLHENHAVLGNRGARLDGAVGLDGEGHVGGDGIACGGHGFAQRVLDARGEADDLARSAFLGDPLQRLAVQLHDLELVSLALGHDLDVRAGDLVVVRVGDVGLGDLDLGLRVLHQQHGIAIPVGGGRALGAHVALLVHGEGRVGGHGVAVGSDLLAQGVGLADLEALDQVLDGTGLVLLGRPRVYLDALGVKHAQPRTLKLLVTSDVRLRHEHAVLGILDEDVVVLDGLLADRDGAVLPYNELGIGRDGVTLGRHGLAQGVLDAGLEPRDDVGGAVGVPLELLAPEHDDLAGGVEHLHVRALELLLARDVGLRDGNLGLGVLDQQLTVLNFRRRLAGIDSAVRVERERGLGRDGVARRCNDLAQRVDDACDKALDLVSLLARHPLVEYLFFAVITRVNDLHLCAGQLEAVSDVGLLDADRRERVLNENGAGAGGLRLGGDGTVRIEREGNVGGDGVASGSNGLVQHVVASL